MKKIIGIIALSAIMLTSCQTLTQSSRDVNTGAALNSVTLADLEVSDTRESYTISNVPKSMYAGGEENVKRIAEGKILEKANADVLFEPRYHIEKKRGLFGGSKVTSITVSGRPANFKNFRTIHDSILFRPEKVYVERGKSAASSNYKSNIHGAKKTYSSPILDRKKYLSVGLGFATNVHAPNTAFAYNVSYGVWKPISKKKRWQVGFEVGLSSQLFSENVEKYDPYYDYYYDYYYDRYYYQGRYYYERYDYVVHNIHIVPIRIAYIHEIGRNSALGLHIAPLVTISYATSGEGSVGDFGELFNIGFKSGLQYRYKNFMFDFNTQYGFLEQWGFGGMRGACTFNFGYFF